MHRRLCIRTTCSAQDRPDILSAAKEMASLMSQPHTMAWEVVKRRGWYLLGKPRVVHRFVTQRPVDNNTLNVDSEHAAGCLRTRRSTTGIAAFHGKHVVKAASTTQTVIALSSGESEFFGIALGTATALGMKGMARDYGHEVKVAFGTDSVSGRGMSLRLGAGKVRHVDIQWSWCRESATGEEIVQNMGLPIHEGPIAVSS